MIFNSLYLDASTFSIVVTSVSGIAVAVGAAAVILFRKAKKKVAKTLGIDENANKEVEEDIVLTQTDEDED